MPRKELRELIADKKRQAVASLGGYIYQIWETLFRWINLKENEVIFLEGAEDLDILSPKGAETVQVKTTTGPRTVTLRSKEVKEAISNFWEHQKNNPENKIELYLLTTANRGNEKYQQFGGKNGLDYWDSCRRPEIDTTPLKDFLLNEIDLSEELAEFIGISEAPQLKERLIRKIHWKTGNHPKEYIEGLVEKRITCHGDKFGIPPSIAKSVIPHLLKYILDIVCKERDRRLDYSDFLNIFEERTTIRVPVQHLAFQNETAHLAQQLMLIGGLLGAIGFPKQAMKVQAESGYIFSSPPLPEKIAKREELVLKLSECLNSRAILVLKGTIGVGKSILARLVVAKNEYNWKWISLRGLTSDQIKELLLREAIILGEQNKEDKIVLDDLGIDPQSIKYEYALEGLLHVLASSNGKIMITTQGEVPNRIILSLQIAPESLVNVPFFTIEEIKELAYSYGCPVGTKLDSWSKALLAITCGHPQLVHAYVKNLEANKWPQVIEEDILKAEDIESVRREARMNLVRQSPSKEARKFLYQLSMIKYPFRRDHAIELGTRIDELINPGEELDLLTGPWIERLNADYFRVSPLLDHAAEAVYSALQLKEINKEIAEAFLACKKLTLHEAKVIMFHGFLGSSGVPIMAMLSSLLRAPDDSWRRIADEFWWLAEIGLEKEKKLFPSDPSVNNWLRLFQFRIAVEIDSINLAPRIAELWENELDYGQESKLKILDNIVYLIKTIIHYEVPFSQATVISSIAKLIAFINDYEIAFKQPFKLDDSRSYVSLVSGLFLFAITRCRSINDLEELLTSLSGLPEKTRDDILSLLMTETDPAEILLNNVFLDQYASRSPQWDRFIIVLERTIELAISWKVKSLARAAYRTIAVIQDEQQNKSEEALIILHRAIEKLNCEHPFLGNERATILYRQKHYKEALDLWEEILPSWPKHTVFLPFFHLPYAEDCAAKLDNWNEVKKLALLGEKLASEFKEPTKAVGFHADYAFALWKMKEYQDSINSFAKVLDQLPTLPSPTENIHSYKLHKLVGHALAWMTQEASDRIVLAEPGPGCFSYQEVDERIKEFPLQPLGFMWYFLADLEYKVGSGALMFERLKRESTKLDLPFIYYITDHIHICHLLRGLQFKSLAPGLKDWCKSYELSQKHVRTDKDIFKKLDISVKISENELCYSFQYWLPRILLAAIVKLVNMGDYANAPVVDWKADSIQSGCWSKELDSWFKSLEDIPSMNSQDLYKTMHQGDSETRCIAALTISSKELVEPSIYYYANLLIVEIMKNSPWIDAIDSDIEQIISRNWLYVAFRQRFALISPTVNCRLIIDACNDQSKGLKKAAKILLAVKNAVRVSIPEDVMMDLKKLAEARGRP